MHIFAITVSWSCAPLMQEVP